ncbi:MAG TPA: hypothetical protein DHW45_09480 [Candidatus Latescibacteria bacterium]|nr:hypothetical protein [Candidatus Latescibacterota bacterium]
MTRIIHTSWFHQFIRWARLRQIAGFVLRTISPRFRYGETSYRVHSPESFSVASEIFKQRTYDSISEQNDVRTIVDLGCNTGYFTCFLAEHFGADMIEGILVDADTDVLAECDWHLDKNGIRNCRTLHAVVGPEGEETAEFHVGEFNISSSARGFEGDYPFPARAKKSVQVPLANLRGILADTFGDRRVDILKIDIEGSEADLLAGDLGYLRQVDTIVIEWHKWVLDFGEVKMKLKGVGFSDYEILKEDSICGVACFRNVVAASDRECSLGSPRVLAEGV